MAVIIKKTVGRIRLADGTILKPGDEVSEAQLKKVPKLKEHTEDKSKSAK